MAQNNTSIRFKPDVYEMLWQEARKHDMPLARYVAWFFEQHFKSSGV